MGKTWHWCWNFFDTENIENGKKILIDPDFWEGLKNMKEIFEPISGALISSERNIIDDPLAAYDSIDCAFDTSNLILECSSFNEITRYNLSQVRKYTHSHTYNFISLWKQENFLHSLKLKIVFIFFTPINLVKISMKVLWLPLLIFYAPP